MSYRSLLFVPGNRPERFGKALAAGADVVCVDLEDAVAPDQKTLARQSMLDALRQTTTPFGVRINGVTTDLAQVDAEALSGAEGLSFVMVPKAESPEQLAKVSAWLGTDTPLWPVIESAEGLYAAWGIAAAPGVAGVLFGGADYAADLGCAMTWDALLFARGQLAAAAARGGVDLLDVPHLDLNDLADLTHSTERVKALGFTGRACIHPSQVAAINDVFTPAASEVDRARRVLAAFAEAEGAAALLDGKLIELPLVRAARRTLERAGGA